MGRAAVAAADHRTTLKFADRTGGARPRKLPAAHSQRPGVARSRRRAAPRRATRYEHVMRLARGRHGGVEGGGAGRGGGGRRGAGEAGRQAGRPGCAGVCVTKGVPRFVESRARLVVVAAVTVAARRQRAGRR